MLQTQISMKILLFSKKMKILIKFEKQHYVIQAVFEVVFVVK